MHSAHMHSKTTNNNLLCRFAGMQGNNAKCLEYSVITQTFVVLRTDKLEFQSVRSSKWNFH